MLLHSRITKSEQRRTLVVLSFLGKVSLFHLMVLRFSVSNIRFYVSGCTPS